MRAAAPLPQGKDQSGKAVVDLDDLRTAWKNLSTRSRSTSTLADRGSGSTAPWSRAADAGKEATLTGTVSRSARQIELTETFAAHNYDPLPVVASHGDGCWVTDVDGHRYLDCLAAYSALNFGHRHPALIEAARAQLDRLTLTSRAFYNDQIGPFCRDLAALAGMECVLPMNTGVEAVETAIKVARRWGYDVKGVPEDQAQIVVMTNNFHGHNCWPQSKAFSEAIGSYTTIFSTVSHRHSPL